MGTQQWPLSKNLQQGVGKTAQLLLTPLMDLSLLLFMDLLMERKYSSTECLNSYILYPSITVLILFPLLSSNPPHFVSTKCSQQNTFGLFLDF